MASKEYEVLFLFKAQADAAIGQFGRVGSAVKEVENKVAAMQDALAKTGNYQAYSKEIETASKRLDELVQKEQSAQQALQDATAARKAAEDACSRHSMRIVELKAAIQSENAESKVNIALLREAKDKSAEISAETERHKNAVNALKVKKEELKAALQNENAEHRVNIALLKMDKASQEEAAKEKGRHEAAAAALNKKITELDTAIQKENAEHEKTIALLQKEQNAEKEIGEENKRHEEALKKLTDELGREQVALKQSEQEQKAATQAEKDAERAKKNATAAVKAQQTELEKLKATLEKVKLELEQAGIDTKNLEEAEKRLTEQIAQGNKELEERERLEAQRNAGYERMENAINRVRMINNTMNLLEQAPQPAWDFVNSSLAQAAALEKQVSAVVAISGANAEETAAMTEKIRQTGATTVFTAEEAAGAMQSMALAGWDAQQMIAGLPGVVNLAAAAGEDLTQMASIVTDGMNAFQMAGTQAATKFADVLAKTATSSNTNVGLIGEALSYVESTAGNLGYSIEDVSVVLAAMANNALKGSVAGSSLNTTLTRMSGANATAAKQMEKMGLSMYDSTGQAKPLLQFINELRNAFRDFGEDANGAQIAAYNLAGQRGMRGLLSVVNQTDEQWQKVVDDIYAYQGAAEKISDIRLENYAGKVQLLSDAWEDVKITVGNHFLPVATDAVEVLTEMTNGVNGILEQSQPLALFTAGASGAILGMSKAFGVAASAAQSLYFIMSMLRTAGVSLSLGSLLPGAGVALGLAATAGTLMTIFGGETYRKSKEGTQYLEEQQKKLEETEKLAEESRDIFDAAQTPSEKLSALNSIDSSYSAQLDDQTEQLKDAVKNRDDFIQYLKDSGRYQQTFDISTGEMVLDQNAMTTTEWKSLQDYNAAVEQARGGIERLARERGAYQQKAKQYIREETGLQRTSIDLISEMQGKVNALGGAWAQVWEDTEKAYSGTFSLFEKPEEQIASLNDMTAALEGQKTYWETWTKNMGAIQSAAQGAGLEMSGLWESLAGKGDTQSAAYLQEIADSLGDLTDPDTTKLEELITLYGDVLGAKEEAVSTFTQGETEVKRAFDSFDETMKTAIMETESYDEARAAMLATLDGYTDTLQSEGKSAVYAVKLLGERMRNALYPYPESGFQFALPGTAGKTVTKSGSVSTSISGKYAGGTDSAAPGLALVGEEGPELLWMHGGETVLPAGETKRLLGSAADSSTYLWGSASGGNPLRPEERPGGGDTVNQFSVNVNVQGNADQETVEQLRDYGAQLEGVFRRLLREERVNAQRRAYR